MKLTRKMSLSSEVEEIRSRLHQLSNLLINITCDQIEQNTVLRESLMSILGIKSKTSNRKLIRSEYNLFGRFKDLNRNFDALDEELKTKDHEELVLIATKNKLGKKKDLIALDKLALTKKLVLHVRNQRESWGSRPLPEIFIEDKKIQEEMHDNKE